MREKLIEILADLDCNAEYCKDCEFGNDIDGCVRRQKEIIADRLIANGVTIATDNNVGHKWIHVTERLPDEKDSFLVATDDGVVGEAFLWEGDFYWQEGACALYAKPIGKDVTHWMPLPEPPKGE